MSALASGDNSPLARLSTISMSLSAGELINTIVLQPSLKQQIETDKDVVGDIFRHRHQRQQPGSFLPLYRVRFELLENQGFTANYEKFIIRFRMGPEK